jgi:glycosyltransferase involved in cell wall biosynthesis
MNCSIILPIYNEAGSLDELFRRIKAAFNDGQVEYEVIAVNDGSSDNTRQILESQAKLDSTVKVINLQRNYGQTAAVAAGIAHAKGSIIVPIDADLENDPADIPRLLQRIHEGYDVVSGWRKNRWRNQWLARRIPSMAANKLISAISGVKLSDFGCSLKAYRREVLKGLRLYGDMHRFMAAYAVWNHEARITEIEVSYTPRTCGKSNYGLNRIWKVLLDLLTFKFLSDYANRPIHLFGIIGIFSILAGLAAGALSVYFKISAVHHKDFVQTPLPAIMTMFVVVGVMLILMGLHAEILMRTYHESQEKPTYSIKDTINI